MIAIGHRVGHFVIEMPLGQGGMGDVWVARDEVLERKVALKAIRAERRLDSGSKARFLREARILSQLDHPHICRIHDYVEDAAARADFLVLELVDGRSLATAIDEGLDAQQRMRVSRQIADVLVTAHAAGVIHRDLKPSNVMLTPAGDVKVLDFGLARTIESTDFEETDPAAPAPQVPWGGGNNETLTHATGATRHGAIVGTPGYMSPEQARGERVTTASDMYSLGLLLQALWTGKSPFDSASTPLELIARAREGQTLPVAGVDRDLAALIERLQSPAAVARPTAREAAERLRWIADKPRRRWRNAAVLAALSIAAAAGIKYTVDLRHERALALAARDEAQRRRGQAEELIRFMIGDLRQKLEPVGRLDVLDDVGREALQYFEAVPGGELSDEEQFRRVGALSLIGEVRMAKGDLPGARAAFEDALARVRELVARDPANAEWERRLGEQQFWIGSVLWSQGDTAGAEERFSDYLRVATNLVARDGQDPRWQTELAYANGSLAAVLEARGDPAALDTLRRSVDIKRRLVAADPADAERQKSLANGLSWLGSVLGRRGRLRDALDQFGAELAIRELAVERDAKDMPSREALSICHAHLADLLAMTGRGEEALAHYRADLSLANHLVEHDPDNGGWGRGLAASQLNLGRALLARGELAGARRLVGEGLARLDVLVRSDPTHVEWQRDRAHAHEALARLAEAEGRLPRALADADSALAILTSAGLTSGEARDDRLSLARVRLVRGSVLRRLERTVEARAEWQRAIEALEPFPPADPQVLEVRAQALIHLDRLEEARHVLGILAGQGYRGADLVTLCRGRGLDDCLSPPSAARAS